MHLIPRWCPIVLLLLPATLSAQAADGGASGLRCTAHDPATWGEGEFQRPDTPRAVEFSVGVKGGSGADMWGAPSDTTLWVDPKTNTPFIMPFMDKPKAGFNVAFGAFGEVRFVQYVGIEVDLMFVRHKLFDDTNWRYDPGTGAPPLTAHTRQPLVFTKLSVPILVKGYLPITRRVRLSLGVGPELSWALYSRASFERDQGTVEGLGKAKGFKGLIAKNADDIRLTTAVGMVIDAGVVKIPIELRFSYNFSQPSKYLDRMAFDKLPTDADPKAYPTQGSVIARDTLYGQLLLGLMYDL